MSLSFVALDFETANAFRGSPCAVGMARVLDGEVVETLRLLMRPPSSVDGFDDFNISLHGITPAMVKGEPRFRDRLPEIVAFIGDLPVVTHNAAFDLGVIRDACDESDVRWPTLSYACSLVLARQTYSLLSYSLPWVAEAAGCPLEGHHDPEADAMTAARIFLDIAARRDAGSVQETLTHARCALGHLDPDGWRGSYHKQPGGSLDYLLPPINPDADPTHPFYGREIVFTGALATMTRQQAWEMIAERGATPSDGVTKRTNVLVIGYQDARKLRPGAALSAKAQKAAALRGKGMPIEVMPEEDFSQLLGL
jgi:DNA polymerase III epsilon subunit-like protein